MGQPSSGINYFAQLVVSRHAARAAADKADLEIRPLSGGSEALCVVHVTARWRPREGRNRVASFVVKHLARKRAREAAIYQQLVSRHATHIAPRLLEVHEDGSGVYLAVEAIVPANAWPWRDLDSSISLMRRLGAFHKATAERADPVLADWDYEAELAASAGETLLHLDKCRQDPDLSVLAADMRTLDRVVLELPRLRQMLLWESELASRSIHGDVHPGNATIRRRSGSEPVLIDWGRARHGSPLEDVSSMLQSLRHYEALALRRHDSLFKEYLTGTGVERRITDPLRSAYWVAGACNVLAGALRVHLIRVADKTRTSAQRRSAFLAARDGLRILRRARAWAL